MSAAEDLTVAKEKPTVEDAEHGVKRPVEETDKVHSANDWEHADLGDGERKQKFLRLMGAEKTEHTGKIVIGDREKREERKADDAKKLNEGLEKQYEQGLDLKLKGKKKAGLGFQEEAEKEDDKPDQSGDSNGKAEVTETTESAEAEKKEEKAEATEDKDSTANGEAADKKPEEPVAEDSVSSTDKEEAAAEAEST